jgi:enoyl-CoA hydratase
VMGGGVGLSAHGSHRLVTPRTALAMPETSLGFFPDVGGTWLLSRAPGEIGTYLGLTGARIGGADAIFCGLADQAIEPGQWPVLLDQLAGVHAHEEIASTVASLNRGEAEHSPLSRRRTEIDQAFGGATVEQIVDALTRQATPFASETLALLTARSPMALKVTLAALRHARELRSLKDCLVLELRMALAMATRDDFLEGIRAAVIDKDQKPRWRPSKLEDIADLAVSRIVLGSGEQGQ